MNLSILDLSAKEIVEMLDRRVVGQTEAKKTLSIALRTAGMRYYQKFIEHKEPTIPISNIMLIGSTGTGKTMLVREIGRIFKIPVLILDASQFTASGYKGKNTDTIIESYLETVVKFCTDEFGTESLSKKVPEYLAKGVIFLDEFDKLSMVAGHDEKWKRDIQSSFLTLLDGKAETIEHKATQTSRETQYHINTSDILFVLGGAFSDLRKQLTEKANIKSSIGFNASVKKFKESDFNKIKVTKSNIADHGFMPEIMGRIHSIAQLEDHTSQTLKAILLEADNSLLSQYRDKFNFDNIDLVLSNKLINTVVKLSMEKREGARSLREVLDDVLNTYLYDADKYKNTTLIIKSKSRCSVNHKPVQPKQLIVYSTNFADLDLSKYPHPIFKR